MERIRPGSAVSLAILLGIGQPLGACAGTLNGTVTDRGQPLAGAMVTAFSSDQKRRETVYADAAGRYSLSVDFAGKLSVRARAP